MRVRVARYGRGKKPPPTSAHIWQCDHDKPPHQRLFWCRRLLLTDVVLVTDGANGWAYGDVVGVDDVAPKARRGVIEPSVQELPDLGEVGLVLTEGRDLPEVWVPFRWDHGRRAFFVGGQSGLRQIKFLFLSPERVIAQR